MFVHGINSALWDRTQLKTVTLQFGFCFCLWPSHPNRGTWMLSWAGGCCRGWPGTLLVPHHFSLQATTFLLKGKTVHNLFSVTDIIKGHIIKRTFRPAASPWEKKNIYFYLFTMWSHCIFIKLHSGKNSFLPAMTNALSVSRRITIKWEGHIELKLCGGKQNALNHICFKYLGMIYCGTLLNACMLEYDPMNFLHLQTWNGSYQCGTMCRHSRLKSLLFLYFLSLFFF